MDHIGAPKKEATECTGAEKIHIVMKKQVEGSTAFFNQGYLLKENIPPLDFERIPHVREDHHIRMPQHVSAMLEATPKKQKRLVEEPITPTFNLKLLMNLGAKREYANCDSPESKNLTPESSPVIFPSKEKLKRKEKSLSIICTRFLSMYPLYPNADQDICVSLDHVCYELGIERRRLYDIVNVFESIYMLNKLSKNRYRWFGKINLHQSLQKIKETAERENVLAKLQYVLELEGNKPDKQVCLLDDVAEFYQQFERTMSPLTLHLCNEAKREKSLAFMSQRFLMLFLVSPAKIISLSAAAKVLNGFHKMDGGAQMKTHIRRLYDIANVLSSIGLISKEVIMNHYGKKPAFKYIGPDLNGPIVSKTSSSLTTPKKARDKSKSFTRHSSFQDICEVAEMEHRKLCLDESPKSAPPFDRSLHNQVKHTGVTSFSNFAFPSSPDVLKPTGKEVKASVPAASPKTPAQTKGETRFFPIQPNMTVVNVPKGVFSGNAPYYLLSPVLNSESIKSPKQISALLLFTPESSSKALILNKTPKSEVGASNSSEPLNMQRSNLKSTNNELSTPQATPLNLNIQHGIPKKLKFISEPDEVVDVKSRSKDTSEVNMECCESSSKCSTRNSSPMSSTSRFGSPFSIPSGYVTPVPSVSLDTVFPSGVETSSILKGIEADSSDQLKNIRTTPIAQKNEAREKGPMKGVIDDKENSHSLKTPFPQSVKQLLKPKVRSSTCVPLKDISNFSMWNNSCSNDSVNSEVSEILSGKKLGEHVCGKKHLELDENTILSPIKKTKKELFPATPSQLVTLPYIPDQMFVFDSSSYQTLSVNKVIRPGPLKFNFQATKNNINTS